MAELIVTTDLLDFTIRMLKEQLALLEHARVRIDELESKEVFLGKVQDVTTSFAAIIDFTGKLGIALSTLEMERRGMPPPQHVKRQRRRNGGNE